MWLITKKISNMSMRIEMTLVTIIKIYCITNWINKCKSTPIPQKELIKKKVFYLIKKILINKTKESFPKY